MPPDVSKANLIQEYRGVLVSISKYLSSISKISNLVIK